MADPAAPPPQRYLTFPAILVIAANTMNGPGITTLPDVAADAGLFLYATLIALSVAMAAFVCRRMVYAMWSSLEEGAGSGEGDKYDTMAKPEAGLIHMGIDSGKGGEEDEIIPEASKDEDQLTHREHDQGESLLSPKDHAENLALISGPGLKQPNLEETAIVGQSREAYGKDASVYAALTMVASALCLGLAQMMLCAAILDGMFVAVGGKSCAIGLPSPDEGSWIHCTTHSSMKPYSGSGAPTSLMSIGWAIAMVASVAMGTVDLDEMIGVQYFLFGCLAVSAVRFSAVLRGMAIELSGDDEGDTAGGMPAAEEGANGGVSWLVGPNPFQTVGPIMFNFAFVVTSPPSSAMARKEEIAYKALGASCVVMGTLYALIGLCGSTVSNAVRHGRIEGGDDSNLLSLILLSGDGDGPSVLDLGMIGKCDVIFPHADCLVGFAHVTFTAIALFGFSTVASVPGKSG
ncbi:hypothetical protein ACHAWF_007011 [Thalassiosira exigua]